MKKFINKNLGVIIGVAIGAIAGYFYWQLIGCNSGSCSITSSPINSTIYGAFMGGFLLSMFKKKEETA